MVVLARPTKPPDVAGTSTHDDAGDADRKIPRKLVALRNITNMAPSLSGRRAGDFHRALSRLHQAEHGAQDSCLASTVWAEQSQ